MPLRTASAISIFTVLAGCASTYHQPDGSNVARLRVVAPQTAPSYFSGATNALTYPSGICDAPMTLGLIGGVGRLADEHSLGIPSPTDLQEKSFIERTIPAGKRSLFTMRALTGNTTCVITFSFTPETKADYEARMTWDRQKCYVTVRKINADQNGAATMAREDSSRQEPTCSKGLW